MINKIQKDDQENERQNIALCTLIIEVLISFQSFVILVLSFMVYSHTAKDRLNSSSSSIPGSPNLFGHRSNHSL
jgi:hypothetical protein